MKDTNQSSLVTIITPSYNALSFFKDTVNSVVSQTYTNWEWVIVDDCSVDGTREYIKSLSEKDNRIKPIYLSNNKGTAVARNTAIQNAKGKFIAFLDSDDKWEEQKLEKQITFMQESGYAFSFTSYNIITQDGEFTGKVIKAPKKVDYEFLLKNTIIGCLTVMLDIEQLGKVEMPNIRSRQDWAMWLSVLKRGFIAYGLDEPLAQYRKVQGSISSNKIKAAKMNWFVYRKIEKLALIKSAWCFVNYAYNAFKKL